MLEDVWKFAPQKQVVTKKTKPANLAQTFEQAFNVLKNTDPKQSSEPFHQPPEGLKGFKRSEKSNHSPPLSQVLTQFSQQSNHSFFHLAHQGLSDSDFVQITQQLKQNTQVKHLILTGNHLQFNEFAKAGAADLLKVNKHIGWLVLNKNEIGDLGAEHLGAALQDNKSVIHLVLSDNQISDQGLEYILKGIEAHPKCESLFIANNQLTDQSLDKLITFCKKSKTLKRLTISGHTFYDQAKCSVLTQICKSKQILLRV